VRESTHGGGTSPRSPPEPLTVVLESTGSARLIPVGVWSLRVLDPVWLLYMTGVLSSIAHMAAQFDIEAMSVF
jgi:hypothetical protein